MLSEPTHLQQSFNASVLARKKDLSNIVSEREKNPSAF